MKDQIIEQKLREFPVKDSIKKYLPLYKNRLTYHYYYYQAVLTSYSGKTAALLYLDSAFRLGLHPKCLRLNSFFDLDSGAVKASFTSNYLKGFNITLKNRIDSLLAEDQKYRIPHSKEKDQKKKDSLAKLFVKIDESNILFFKRFISSNGYPTARMLGTRFCMPGNKSDPEILIMHLGTSERDFQIQLLKELMDLCKHNQEDWQKIAGIQFNLHHRFSTDYSEFTFLYFDHHKLNIEDSYFSMEIMAKLLLTPVKRFYIKCRSEKVYVELRDELIRVNRSLPLPKNIEAAIKTLKIQPLERIDATKFVFVEDRKMPHNTIYYKIEHK